MRSLKNLFPLFAIVLGLGLVFTQSSFKAVDDQIIWVYDSNDINEALDGTKYHIDMDATSCPVGDSLPCIFITDDAVDDQGKLTTFLSGNYTNPEDVLEDAETRD